MGKPLLIKKYILFNGRTSAQSVHMVYLVLIQEALQQRDAIQEELQGKVDDVTDLTQTLAQLRQQQEQWQFDGEELREKVSITFTNITRTW